MKKNSNLFLKKLDFNILELKETDSVCSFLYNPKSQKSTIRTFYGIYWDKPTISKVWKKLKYIRKKVIQKKKR